MRPRRAQSLPAPRPDWAYFFDVDGTLVDIADAPGGAGSDGDVRRLLVELYQATGGAVALISGRSLGDIDRLVPDLRLPAAGQHGIERRDAAGRVSRHASPSADLETVRRGLAAAAARHPGLVVEDKGLSLALHYRRAPRLAGYAHRLVRSLLAGAGGVYGVQAGKRVVEVKPAGKDKGVAVLEFMQEDPFRGRTPVFVGDDSTDEDAFETVNRLHGHSVKVGPGRTVARRRLRDVRAVRAWLAQRATEPAT
jgi:trehalose 6-phosphate phosphatase